MIRNGYKKCNECLGEWYPAEKFFNVCKGNSDGLSGKCKDCRNKRRRRRHALNPEIRNKADRAWRAKNPEKERERCRRYCLKNPEKRRESVKRWQVANPEKFKEINRRTCSIPRNRLSRRMRTAVRLSLKHGKEGRHWESLVGYTQKELMIHLESQFTKGMSWENMGEWHIDHIRPISDFEFESTDDTEFKECWSLWNLQPLWSKDNMIKHTKCDNPPLPLLIGIKEHDG